MQYSDAESFPMDFTLDNPIIIDRNGTMKTIATQELVKLDAEGKTVFVTDSYLFVSHDDNRYEADLRDILKSLKAKEIHYCAKEMRNQNLFSRIKQELASVGCSLTHDVLSIDCHDRFWLCKESNKAIAFGTSLNGLCRKICRISELTDVEISELTQALQDDGIAI